MDMSFNDYLHFACVGNLPAEQLDVTLSLTQTNGDPQTLCQTVTVAQCAMNVL